MQSMAGEHYDMDVYYYFMNIYLIKKITNKK